MTPDANPHRWLVIICREGAIEVVPFAGEEQARAFFDRASWQWSDSYLTQVVVGPRDLCGACGESSLED